MYTTWDKAILDLKKEFELTGFNHVTGNMYMDKNKNPVDCVLAVQHISNTTPWFSTAVRDIRMMRIESSEDMLIVLS